MRVTIKENLPTVSIDPTTIANDGDGVTDALMSAYERDYNDLYKYAVRRVGPQHAADALQRAVEIAVRKINRRVVQRGLRPWLFRILDFELKNMAGEEETWRRCMDVHIDGPDVDMHTDRVIAQVDARRLNARLADALAQLKPRDRDVVYLLVDAGLSYEETAAELRISAGTVGSRFTRARRKLRELLGDIVFDQARDREDMP
ncbi:sigma-70 family RNA polymerase sigma factor [Longispora sp. K20-0274]|uniref:RNA polymerase sigma factor n=1 Tax=Longispora sp. K20-0274 TaxID=3088255 RepID=UPI0039999B3F